MKGNQQKTRKALAVIYDWILKAGYVYGYPDTQQKRRQLYDMMTKALSAPPRNCDIGTAEDQKKRFVKFCQMNHEYWKPSKSLTAIQKCNCPCQEGNSCNHFIWAQMPYKDGENDGSK